MVRSDSNCSKALGESSSKIKILRRAFHLGPYGEKIMEWASYVMTRMASVMVRLENMPSCSFKTWAAISGDDTTMAGFMPIFRLNSGP